MSKKTLPVIDPSMNALANLGVLVTFVRRVLGGIPVAMTRYRHEVFRLLADISWGTGAILIGGGTVGVMILLSLSAGTSLGIEGFNGLETIGLSPLTGFVSATVNTRELAPLIAALALAAQVGCRFTAHLGSMRIHEEIDALSALAVQPLHYLVTTRVLASMFAILPLYLIGLVGSYVATEIAVTVIYDQPAGTFQHYFQTFIDIGDILKSIVKIMVFAIAVTLVHCWYGYTAGGGAQGVGTATGRAIRASIVLVVVLNMVMTMIFWGNDAGVRISG